jgi:hypothetical protein
VGDELTVLYTNILQRHQRNRVPSHLLLNCNGGILRDGSKLLRFRNTGVQAETKRLPCLAELVITLDLLR